jgi:sialic acid synthase SpsE
MKRFFKNFICCKALKNIHSIRPGFGLHPRYLAEILGKEAIGDGRPF